MIKANLIASASGKELHTHEGYDGEPVLITATHGSYIGHFNTVTRSSQGTTTIVSAQSDDAIVLTDLILTTDKVAGASATVIITDGANSETLIAAKLNDAPCNVAISFAGHWQTWRACYIDLITINAVTATVALGYYRIPWDKAMAYGEWNALR